MQSRLGHYVGTELVEPPAGFIARERPDESGTSLTEDFESIFCGRFQSVLVALVTNTFSEVLLMLSGMTEGLNRTSLMIRSTTLEPLGVFRTN
jgi:hypothetical protein